MDYYRARYYHPCLGAFLGRDPIEDDTNLYRYCRNAPSVGADPSGLKWKVMRKGETVAECCRENSGDTVDTLASEIGLDARDSDKWLLRAFGRYYVPNTIYCVWGGVDVVKFNIWPDMTINLGKVR